MQIAKKQTIDDQTQLDITAPENVEIVIRRDAEVIWVNVEGICRLRCCRIKHLTVNGPLPKI